MTNPLHLDFAELDLERDSEGAASFLSQNTWPFHGRSTLTVEDARQIKLCAPDQVRSFWINENDSPVGLVRVFDLEDADHGSVLFDLRIAAESRGRGIGRIAVAWIVDMLFSEYPSLHRIEATTRFDNHAMRHVLELNRFVLEGRLRETWSSDDGTRYDTALYSRLRSDA